MTLETHPAIVEAAMQAAIATSLPGTLGLASDETIGKRRDQIARIIVAAVRKVCAERGGGQLTVENIAKWLADNRHRVAVVVNDDHDVFEIKRVIHAIENKSQGESLLIAIQPVRAALPQSESEVRE